MPTFIQPSFAKGEIAPALYGRVDTAAYQVALKTAYNAIVHAYGGVSNRPGLQFIAPVKDHSYAPRMIEFEFNTDDTYVLEFGDEYMRVIRNDAHVTETALTGATATAADPVVVTKASHGFSNGDEVFHSGFTEMTELNGRRFVVANKTTDTYELTDQVTGADIDGSGWDAETTGGSLARIYTITSPFAIEDLPELKYVQNADVMTLTHDLYPIYELSRTDHNAWSFAVLAVNPEQDNPTGQTVTPDSSSSNDAYYRVTALAADGEESLPAVENGSDAIEGITLSNPIALALTSHTFETGDEVEIEGITGTVELNGRRFRVVDSGADEITLQDTNGNAIDGTAYTAWSSGGTVRRTFVKITTSATTRANTIAWTAVAGADRYAVYYRDNGIYGLIGETEVTDFYDNNIEADTSITPPKYAEPFLNSGNYPQASGYFEQRRVFGGSINKPDTSIYSKTGNQTNFTKSVPFQTDDAIEATLNAQKVNEIRHFVPLNDLIILTAGAEWRVNSGGDSGFAIDTIKQKPQSNWGTSHRKPIVSGTTVLFVQGNDATVRSFGYSLQIDGYSGTNLNLLAHHMLQRNTIVDWAYSRYPDPIVYMVRDDGDVLCMTFDQEQEIIAWTTWHTRGKFEAVAAVQSSPSEREESGYFVVRRRINGNTVRYIEKVHSRNFDDVRDCFFVDSGLSYDSPITITGVTAADPVVITAPAHGLSNGDEVDIFDIEWEPDFDDKDTETQPDQLNRRRYTVANKTTDTFEIQDQDGDVDGTAFNAYVDGGTVRLAVDSFAAYSFEHLAGQAVSVLADGNVVENKTIGADGSISFDRKFSRFHIGLKYITDIETLNIETRPSTIQGKQKKIARVVIKLDRSRGLFVGNDATDLTEGKFRQFEAMSDPTALFTGDYEQRMPPDWNSNGRVLVRQRYPLPMTVLAVVPDTEVGDI